MPKPSSKPSRKPSRIAVLETRLARVERVLRLFAAHNRITARVLDQEVAAVDGIYDVRGNDGVLLSRKESK